jgi:hypothetical protein
LPWKASSGSPVEDLGTLLTASLDVEPAPGAAAGPSGSSGATPAEPPLTEPAAPPPSQEIPAVDLPRVAVVKRPGRYGLHVDFEYRPGDLEPARLVESTIRINEAHPAYKRAVVSRSLGYHVGVSVAFALAPLATDASREHQFITSFLVRWGEAVNGSRAGRHARAR